MMITSNSPPISMNMTTMEKDNTQHTTNKFPLRLDPLGKPDHQALQCPTANFGPLLKGSVTNQMLITVFDIYLTPKSPGA